MRNRSGSDLEGVGRRRAGMEGLGAFSAMLECIIIDAEHSIRDIFTDFRTSGWSCYGNFQILMTGKRNKYTISESFTLLTKTEQIKNRKKQESITLLRNHQ